MNILPPSDTRIIRNAPMHWPPPAIARGERPPKGPTATGPDTQGGLDTPDLTQEDPKKHVVLASAHAQNSQHPRAPKTAKRHHCAPPPPPQPSLPVVPKGLNRQRADEHGGLTIEAMTTAVIAALDKHKYTYELPHEYSVLRPFGNVDVPECSFQPHHPNGYGVPQITFTEAYKAATMMSPAEKNTAPATIVWYGFRREVKTTEEITDHIDHCHAKFESDRHENWEEVAEKTLEEHRPHFGKLIGEIMSKAAHSFQDKDKSLKRIADKVHADAVDALRIALKGELSGHSIENSVSRNAPAANRC